MAANRTMRLWLILALLLAGLLPALAAAPAALAATCTVKNTNDAGADSLRAALADAGRADRIVVFGSFYTVGGVLKAGLPRLPAPHLPDSGRAGATS